MTRTGTTLFASTGTELGAGAFDGPFGIAFNPVTGHVYVSDTWNDRVVELGY